MKIGYLALAVKKEDHDAGFTHSYHICRALARRADVVLLVSGRMAGVLEAESPRTVELRLPTSLEAPLHPLTYAKSIRLARRELEGAGIIHERFRFNPTDLMFIPGRKYLLELNDLACMGLTGMWRGLRGRVARRKVAACDALVTQTDTLKALVSRFTDKPVHVVPNGVDVAQFSPSAASGMRKHLGIREEEIVILYVGSMRPWHAIPMIVQAAREIGRRRKDVTFVAIGRGPGFEEARRVSGDLGNFILPGSVPMEDVPGFIAGSDICIAPFSSCDFPPLREVGFWWCPVKIFEYMACAKPVVTMDYPELVAIVEDAGLLAASDDAGDFTGKILTLVENERLRRKMGERGRALAVEKHSWDRRADQLLSIYESL